MEYLKILRFQKLTSIAVLVSMRLFSETTRCGLAGLADNAKKYHLTQPCYYYYIYHFSIVSTLPK
jgi:hypothetical protein